MLYGIIISTNINIIVTLTLFWMILDVNMNTFRTNISRIRNDYFQPKSKLSESITNYTQFGDHNLNINSKNDRSNSSLPFVNNSDIDGNIILHQSTLNGESTKLADSVEERIREKRNLTLDENVESVKIENYIVNLTEIHPIDLDSDRQRIINHDKIKGIDVSESGDKKHDIIEDQIDAFNSSIDEDSDKAVITRDDSEITQQSKKLRKKTESKK